jgi:hypothetical protein
MCLRASLLIDFGPCITRFALCTTGRLIGTLLDSLAERLQATGSLSLSRLVEATLRYALGYSTSYRG